MPDAGRATLQMYGIRAHRPAATLPQTTQAALFTILNGRVIIVGIIGRVTVVMGATANNLSLVANPTTGADIALSAVVATANDPVGTMYGITGVPADALVKGNVAPMALRAPVVPVGSIDLLASASNTGQAEWTCYWVPMDPGARVAVA